MAATEDLAHRPSSARGAATGSATGVSWRWWLGSVVSIALLLSAYRYLDQVKSGRGWLVWPPLINETTAVVGAGLLFFGVRALVHRRPLDRSGWARQLPWYLLALLTFSVLHTSMNWGSRALLYPLFGLGPYHYGPMPMPYAMELPIDVILFAGMVAGLLGARQAARVRAQALETARLSRALAESRLEALGRSLEPHFLFNALNTISSTLYRDVEAADEMIQHLGDLLRAALARPAAEVTLAAELETLTPYVALLRARFEDRLELTLDIEPEAERALVPALLLQPLVENAVRHGGAENLGRGRVVLTAARRGGELVVRIDDEGPGLPPGVDPLASGHGLRTTAERLRLLHGEAQSLQAGNRPAGGFRVEVRLPYRLPGDEP